MTEFTLTATSDLAVWIEGRGETPTDADWQFILRWETDTHRYHAWLQGRALPETFHANRKRGESERYHTNDHKELSFAAKAHAKTLLQAQRFLEDDARFEAAMQAKRQAVVDTKEAVEAKREAAIRAQLATVTAETRQGEASEYLTSILVDIGSLKRAELFTVARALAG